MAKGKDPRILQDGNVRAWAWRDVAVVLAVAAPLNACVTTGPKTADHGPVSAIFVRRGPCFMECDEFTIHLKRGGKVIVTDRPAGGEGVVKVTKCFIKPEEFDRLAAWAVEHAELRRRRGAVMGMPDHQRPIMSYTADGRELRSGVYENVSDSGCPRVRFPPP